MDLRTILDTMDDVKRRILLTAFEAGTAAKVEVAPGVFVTVNCPTGPGILESSGPWALVKEVK